jgi:hypothetical protein
MNWKTALKTLPVSLVIGLSWTGCKNSNDLANIPGTAEIYGNIQYLDSLVRSHETDSISGVLDQIYKKIGEYHNNIQSATDKLVMDSMQLISSSVKEYVQLCTDVQPDLLLLKQETQSAEEQYRAGKIKLSVYVAKLMEQDATLIEMSNKIYDMRTQTFHLLSRYNYLSGLLLTPQEDTFPTF